MGVRLAKRWEELCLSLLVALPRGVFPLFSLGLVVSLRRRATTSQNMRILRCLRSCQTWRPYHGRIHGDVVSTADPGSDGMKL